LVKHFLLNPLQIYTDYATTQVTAREIHPFVDNLMHLLIKGAYFIEYFMISMVIRVYSILAFISKVYPFKSDFTSIARFPGSLISCNTMKPDATAIFSSFLVEITDPIV